MEGCHSTRYARTLSGEVADWVIAPSRITTCGWGDYTSPGIVLFAPVDILSDDHCLGNAETVSTCILRTRIPKAIIYTPCTHQSTRRNIHGHTGTGRP